MEKAGIAYASREALLRALAIVKPKVKHLSDVPEWIGFLFTEDYPFEESSLEKALGKPGALERLKSLGEALRSSGVVPCFHRVEAEGNRGGSWVKAGDLVHPARVAVSGKSVGPGLYEMLEILGGNAFWRASRAACRLAHGKRSNAKPPFGLNLRSSAPREFERFLLSDERDDLRRQASSSTAEVISSGRSRRRHDFRFSAIPWPTRNPRFSRTPRYIHAASRRNTSRFTRAPTS